MTGTVRMLLLEDDPNDAELLRYTLKSSGVECDLMHVSNESAFRSALSSELPFDLIISDYTLPSFDGKKALALAKQSRPETPFIFVSGTIGEEAAIESLIGGATDYVLKHRFTRLVPAIRRAVTENAERNARRRAELELHNTLEQLKNLFDNLDEVFFSLDPRTDRLLQISPACERLYGTPRQTFFENPGFWKRVATTADLPTIESAQAKLMAGLPVSCEYRITQANGTLKWVLARMKPVRSDGEIVRVDGIISDITERKNLEAQFLRAQRLENLGSLAGGIAHDLNNVLAPIMMGIELLRQRDIDSINQATLATLEVCTKRGANLVKQILMFARGVEERRAALQPARVMVDLYGILRRTIPKAIDISLDVPPDLWMVFADKTQFEQVLMNLCVNARDAMPEGGILTITGRNQMHEALSSDGAKEPSVLIEIGDTGQGIPAENLSKIFDPFFTTKAAGSGTGLGLSTVSAIVKSHGGSISVVSALGRGTTFSIRFPALISEIQREEDVSGSVLPVGNGEMVLVVDDELAVRDFARTLLENYGYRVMVAEDGMEGIAKFSEHKDSIDLVLSDLDMPRMTGYQLIEALQAIQPDVKIIMAGGLIEEDKPLPPNVLQKPFSPAQLLKAIRHVLQDPSSASSHENLSR